jgi:hypothetical protein
VTATAASRRLPVPAIGSSPPTPLVIVEPETTDVAGTTTHASGGVGPDAIEVDELAVVTVVGEVTVEVEVVVMVVVGKVEVVVTVVITVGGGWAVVVD